MNKQSRENADALLALNQLVDTTKCIEYLLTVCAGGILEWPPAAVTSTRTFRNPFSAIPGEARTDPYCSMKPAVQR